MWFWSWFDGPVSGAGICRGGSVLLWLCGGFFLMGFGRWHCGGLVAAIVIVVADVGYCGYCVCFFWVLVVCGQCLGGSGFWCGGMVVISGFLCVYFWREEETEIAKK